MLAEHQEAAVALARERLRRYRGLLLADDVGLGKSFVAAVLGAEFQREGSDVEWIVPAPLVEQWRATLDAFGVRARIVTHASIRNDPFVPDPGRERFVVVDEAHAFRNPLTQRYDALARRTVAARVVLVTATPFCNSSRDLHALLSLIVADDALAGRGVPSIDAAFERRDRDAIDIVLSELMIRRGREVLDDALRFGSIVRRVVRFSPFEGEGNAGRLIDALQFPLVGGAALLRRFLRRRLESSEAALLESIRRQVRFYQRALESLAGGRALTKRDYRRLFGHEEDREAFQQVLFWECWAGGGEDRVSPAAIHAEMARLAALRQCVERSPRGKEALLLKLCSETREPLLIFTSSSATARSIAAALQPVRRCGVVTSRERTKSEALFRAFRDGRLDALVATDLASEGLDLQRAGAVIHYDIPWNPVRLDQRNGRAMRIGQKRRSIEAFYFLPAGDETGIVRTVSVKNRERRRMLDRMSSAPRPADRQRAAPRPRVSASAACARLSEAARLELPCALLRRHKAGVERLIAAMARECLDRAKLQWLRAVLAVEAPI